MNEDWVTTKAKQLGISTEGTRLRIKKLKFPTAEDYGYMAFMVIFIAFIFIALAFASAFGVQL